MLKLKSYQERTLKALSTLFKTARTDGLKKAWTTVLSDQGRNQPYDARAFGDIPCVCLRIPTGGGKTLLGVHAVAYTGKDWQDSDAPVALWLVPSDAIRSQTLEALNNPRHPYRSALESYFPDRVRVCALEELQQVGVQDVKRKAIVVVATIQSFRVSDTKTRNVYAFDEELEPHFKGLTPIDQARYDLELVTEADLENQRFLTTADLGRPKASIANWFHLHRPIVIVDEAHNARTHTSFATLKRLNPAAIIELTATPLPGTNVLHHVSALELKAEHMIKLPIVLAEHPTGWKDAVRDALLTRKRLQTLAQAETDYIRPLALFQAEAKDGEVPVEVLRRHLIEQEGIPEAEIAVATGNQKDLDGINLFDPLCPITCVITVEALKEGWDCSFAYVLCSLQEVRSAKDVEQLLGRVLRMPYARSRHEAHLNQAYAHIIADSFAEAANRLTDRMVNNMGFDPFEAASTFTQTTGPDLFGEQTEKSEQPRLPTVAINLPTLPTVTLPKEVAALVEIRETSQGATAFVRGEMTPEIEDALLNTQAPRHQAKVVEQIAQARATQQAALAPALRGVPFTTIPQLCLWEDDELCVVENTTLAELGGLNLLRETVQLPSFEVRETAYTFEIDLDGKKLSFSLMDSRQLGLDQVPSHSSETDLVRWLDREVRQMDIPQGEMLRYLTLVVQHLRRDRGISLTALIRAQFQLADALRTEIRRLRGLAVKDGFQKALLEMRTARLEDGFRYAFTFMPNQYPARPPYYQGRFRFKKHYYEVIHDLREKRNDGTPSEEFVCAQALERHPLVKHWVRNVEKEARMSFWLPTSTDYFYPDFIAELTDGRVLAVEYKGAHLAQSDDTKEKTQVGAQWEASSDGRCLFLMALKVDDKGRDLATQLGDKLR